MVKYILFFVLLYVSIRLYYLLSYAANSRMSDRIRDFRELVDDPIFPVSFSEINHINHSPIFNFLPYSSRDPLIGILPDEQKLTLTSFNGTDAFIFFVFTLETKWNIFKSAAIPENMFLKIVPVISSFVSFVPTGNEFLVCKKDSVNYVCTASFTIKIERPYAESWKSKSKTANRPLPFSFKMEIS